MAGVLLHSWLWNTKFWSYGWESHLQTGMKHTASEYQILIAWLGILTSVSLFAIFWCSIISEHLKKDLALTGNGRFLENWQKTAPQTKNSAKKKFPEKKFTEEVGQILSKRMGNLWQNILILIFF
jgi:Na+/citrate or Na+/malate symporter